MALPQEIAGLVPGTKVRRKVGCRVNQLAQINDAFDTQPFRRLCEIARGLHVALGVEPAAALAVDQIISSRNALKSLIERGRIERITRCNINALKPGTSLQTSRVAHKNAYRITGVQRARHEPPADITSGAGYEDKLIVGH